MPLAEPTTFFTDLALGALAAFWGWRLLKAPAPWARRKWGLAFWALAVGAVAGGCAHGFARAASPATLAFLWKLTLVTVGAASLLLLLGQLRSSLTGRVYRLAVLAAWVKVALYGAAVAVRNDFFLVILDYGSALGIVLALQMRDWRRGGAAAPWVVAGVLVSFAAAAVQQSGIVLHRYFNHNDLYHLVEMAGLWLLYRGGVLLRDSGTGKSRRR